MDLSKLFFICFPFASQNQAEVWSRAKLVEAQYSTPWQVRCAFGNVETPLATCIFYSRREDEEVEEGVPATIELQVEKILESPDRQSPEQEAWDQECLK